MRTATRRLATIVSALAMAGGLFAGTAGSAAAAGSCSGGLLGNNPVPGGYVAVYYNSSTGYNCAMTFTNKPGVTQSITVGIAVSGSSTSKVDSGMYQYYAGPVSVYAKGKCIDWWGGAGNGGTAGMIYDYCD
jgi:hypothetical protein